MVGFVDGWDEYSVDNCSVICSVIFYVRYIDDSIEGIYVGCTVGFSVA